MPHSPKQIGLIGLGLAGSALAERLLAAGFELTGFDLDTARVEQLCVRGGAGASSAAAVGRACRRIILSLPTSDVVAAVLGELELELARGAILIDTTTGAPERSAAFGERLAARGVQYIDATIGGSSRQMLAGEALLMCGGDRAAYDQVQDVLAALAGRSFYLGPCGAGARMKLVFNLVLGLNRAVLAEGLGYAAACGIEPARALEVLRAGAAYSRIMDSKGPKMLAGDFTPEARLSQHLKDVRLILASGAEHGARLPFSGLHRTLLEELERAGWGAADNSAIVRAFLPEERP